MSGEDPCPHESQLVTLLGHEPTGELRQHLTQCAHCQDELARLRDGFSALGEEPGLADRQVQQRIAAAVMPQILAELVKTPAVLTNVQPLRPRARPELRRLMRLGALTSLSVLPAVLYWTKRGDVAIQPARALGLALLPLALWPAVLGSQLVQRVTLGLTLAVTAVLMFATVDRLELGALHGAGCLMLAASGSFLPALIVLRAAAREQSSAVSGALLGAAIGSGGAALQRLLCGSGELSHTLAFHLGPFLFLIALAGLLGSRAARLLPRTDPTPQQAA